MTLDSLPDTSSQKPIDDELTGQAAAVDEAGERVAGSEPAFERLPLLPLKGTVVLPMTLVPLAAAQPRSLRLIDDGRARDRTTSSRSGRSAPSIR